MYMCRQAIAKAPLDAVDARGVAQKLQFLADSGVPLCRRSARLIEAVDDSTVEAYITAWRGKPVVSPPFITCMAVLPLQSTCAPEQSVDPRHPVLSTVVIGTEASGVFILSNTTFKVEQEWQMENVPSMMCTHGELGACISCTTAYRLDMLV